MSYYVVLYTVDADVAEISSQKAWVETYATREEACEAMDVFERRAYPVSVQLIEVH